MINLKEIISTAKPIDIIAHLYSKVLEMTSCGEDISSLNHQEKVFYLVEDFETIYNNGGFEHFYSHNVSNYSYKLVDALIEIGAIRTAEIVRLSISFWSDEYLSDQEKRRQFLFENSETHFLDKLYELDRIILEQQERLSDLLVIYAKRNIDLF